MRCSKQRDIEEQVRNKNERQEIGEGRMRENEGTAWIKITQCIHSTKGFRSSLAESQRAFSEEESEKENWFLSEKKLKQI